MRESSAGDISFLQDCVCTQVCPKLCMCTCSDADKQLSSAECLEGGFLEKEPKKRKRRGGMVC